jgi:hypothetical protein
LERLSNSRDPWLNLSIVICICICVRVDYVIIIGPCVVSINNEPPFMCLVALSYCIGMRVLRLLLLHCLLLHLHDLLLLLLKHDLLVPIVLLLLLSQLLLLLL